MTPDIGQPPYATVSTAVKPLDGTSPITLLSRSSREPPRSFMQRRRLDLQTIPEIDPTERGDEQERNRADRFEVDRGQIADQAKRATNGESGRVRSEVARDLVQRVDQLLPLTGNVSIATYIGLLKRDLSRSHDTLRDHPEESCYLSIVTLVESALTQLKWNQYSKTRLDAIHKALDIGYRQVTVRFEDYERAKTLLSQHKVDAAPRIDLESIRWEDIADDEEE